MADTAADIRRLIRADGAEPDRAAIAHVLTSTGFLALGAVGAALSLISMAFPAFLPLGYGIIRAATMLALIIGFAILSLIGGAYYVLPRLTGAPLWNENLARLGLIVTAVTTVSGMVLVAAGFGDGGEPFALPWWVDIPMLVGLSIPAVVVLQTIRRRVEHRSYVTIPYVATGLVALPLLYVAGNVPGVTALASALGDLYFSSAVLVAVVLLMAVGLVYYAIVKQGDRPLAGRQLAQVGFWSLLFGTGWFGVAQMAGGPVPDWLGAVAAVLGLALPVGAVATAATVINTVEGAWRDKEGVHPVALAAVAGCGFVVVITTIAAVAGFRSAAALVALTPFWEGINYGLLLGAFPLLIASWTYQALPAMMGRRLYSAALARRHVRLTVVGTGSLVLLMVLAGLTTGYSWAGGAFTGAFSAVGEGWAAAAGPGGVFLGLAVAAGLVAVGANLLLASLIFRTVTQGHVTAQEVLVARRAPDE